MWQNATRVHALRCISCCDWLRAVQTPKRLLAGRLFRCSSFLLTGTTGLSPFPPASARWPAALYCLPPQAISMVRPSALGCSAALFPMRSSSTPSSYCRGVQAVQRAVHYHTRRRLDVHHTVLVLQAVQSGASLIAASPNQGSSSTTAVLHKQHSSTPVPPNLGLDGLHVGVVGHAQGAASEGAAEGGLNGVWVCRRVGWGRSMRAVLVRGLAPASVCEAVKKPLAEVLPPWQCPT
jgi:hypothetical protein